MCRKFPPGEIAPVLSPPERPSVPGTLAPHAPLWQHFHVHHRGLFVHWILLLVAAAAFAGAILAPTQGMIVVALIVAFAFLFAGFIAMVSARIAERARPPSVLLTDADVDALRKSVRDARRAREQARPPATSHDEPGS